MVLLLANTSSFGGGFDCATCSGNLVTNPGFESGTTGWGWSGGAFSAGSGAVACGTKSGDFQITNTSANWVSQTIGTDLPAGTVINAKVYAGTHDNSYYHEVGVYFFDANWNWISGSTVEVNKILANTPSGPQLYTWTAVVPAGAKYTQVGFNGNGNWIKTDEWCVTLAPSSTVAFGDQLYVDLNGNGIKDGSDWGYDGITIKLYADANEDGSPDGAALATTLTSGGGYYNFANLAPGKYMVQVENVPSWMYLIPKNAGDPDNNIDNDNNGISQSGTTIKGSTITLTVGGEPGGSYNSTYDLAVYKDNGLGDFVFLDANGNGIQETGETGIAGVTVRLKNSAGTVLATTTTDATGFYSFYDPVQYGTTSYKVEFVTPAGYSPSPSNQGSDDQKDSDPVSGVVSVTVPVGTWNNTIDAGFVPKTLSLGNFVWNDRNNNGTQDAGESAIGSVTVKLYADANGDNIPDGAAVATTTTDANGLYSFSGLAAGKYIAAVVLPTGYAAAATTATSLSPDNDNNTDNNGVTTVSGEVRSNSVTLTAGGEPTTDGDGNNGNLTLDFGLKGTGSIGDNVWNDLNGNGIQDAGEPGISGVTVTLAYPGGATITTTTDANGNYLFSNLAPANYSVTFTTSSGYIAAPANQGSDDAKDSDPANGSVSVVLSAGENNLTIDAGFVSNQLALGNYVWNDVNNNGVQDAGEPGVGGATVKLYTDANADNIPDGPAVATTVTNASGLYSFTGLTPGKYIAGVTIPAGYVVAAATATSTTPDNNDNTDNNGVTTVSGEVRSRYITLTTAGEPTTDGDASNGNLTLDFGLRGTLSLGNAVWGDVNDNGIFEAGELGINGVQVNLYVDANANNQPDDLNGDNVINSSDVIATATTASGGLYQFNYLGAGNYIAGISVPSGYAPGAGATSASPNDDINNDDNGIVFVSNELRSNYISLGVTAEPVNDGDGSNSNLTLDFGITPSGVSQLYSISGNLFYDANRLTDNTVNGYNITPYPTEYVLLINTATGLVDAVQQLPGVLSANEGKFSFTNLPGGNTYYVMLSKDYVAPGSPAPLSASLPAFYYPTGENIGSSSGSDGTIDSKSALIYLNRNITQVNFGIVYVRPGNVD
ncbi:MAG: SdrD B-like domain-containing protein [Lacibacter sp.]